MSDNKKPDHPGQAPGPHSTQAEKQAHATEMGLVSAWNRDNPNDPVPDFLHDSEVDPGASPSFGMSFQEFAEACDRNDVSPLQVIFEGVSSLESRIEALESAATDPGNAQTQQRPDGTSPRSKRRGGPVNDLPDERNAPGSPDLGGGGDAG